MPEMTSEGAVLAVLAEVADRADSLAKRLEKSLLQADDTRAAVSRALDVLNATKAQFKQVRSDMAKSADERDGSLSRSAEASDVIDKAERRLKEIQKMLDFGVQDEELFSEMGASLNAKQKKTQERETFRKRADAADARVTGAQAELERLQLDIEAHAVEVKELQHQLPDPHLFAFLGLAQFGRAGAHFLLNRDASQFDRHYREGAAVIRQMHQEMREGRYRLDRFGDLLAGRHEASIQAILGAVAVGDLQLATEIFSLVADPGMYFHHIFNVFRTWLVGSYLLGDKKVLGNLLRVHRFDKGVWRGYCLAFRGLVEQKQKELNVGIDLVLSNEVRFDDATRLPGLGLVHLPALALARLGGLRHLKVTVKDERLPDAIYRW